MDNNYTPKDKYPKVYQDDVDYYSDKFTPENVISNGSNQHQ